MMVSRRPTTLIALCIILLSISASLPCRASEADDLLAGGLAAAKEGDFARAKELLGQLISKYPTAPQAAEASWKLGFVADRERDIPLAEQLFRWVTEQHPKSPKAPDSLLRLAYLAKKAGRPDALERFLDVILRYPDSSAAAAARYRAARLQGGALNLDLAAQNFDAVKNDPKASVELRAEAATLEGISHLQKWYKTADAAELERGITLLEGVQDQFPKDTKGVAWSRHRLALYYIYSGRYVTDERFRHNPERGRQILQDAIRTLPQNYFTWWMKQEIPASYVVEQKYEEAIAELETFLAQDPPNSWKEYAMYLLGDCQARVDRKGDALATFREAATLFPNSEWGRLAKSRIRALEK